MKLNQKWYGIDFESRSYYQSKNKIMKITRILTNWFATSDGKDAGEGYNEVIVGKTRAFANNPDLVCTGITEHLPMGEGDKHESHD